MRSDVKVALTKSQDCKVSQGLGFGEKYEDLQDRGMDVPDYGTRNNQDSGESKQPMPASPTYGEETYTIQEAIDAIGFGKFQIKLSMLAGLAWMADAMEMMILSILSPALHCDWQLPTWKQALITTVVFAGMMVSSGLWGSICDKYGRKAELIMSSAFTFYFGILSAFSPTFIWMLILRGLVGFGIGGAPQAVTLYAEFLPSGSRAKCVILIELFWALGSCFEVVLALVIMPTLGWRWLLIMSAFPLLVFMFCCFWLPESARFDLTRGRHDRALATIEKIAQDNGKPMPLGRLSDVNTSGVHRGQIKDLFIPELKRTTLLLWIIWLANAFAYYGIVLMTTELFEFGDSCHGGGNGIPVNPNPACFLDCKPLTTNDYVDLLWTTFAEFPGILITVFIIDRIGRRKTMTLEFLVFSLFVLLVNICSTRPVLTLFLFVARGFISGAFQAAYVYTPEVYPTSIRAMGLGACSGMARVGAIVTPFVAQVLLGISPFLAISLYGIVCILAAIAAFFLPIETMGRDMTDTSKPLDAGMVVH
ncbi:synaptic vesicle 2-related protein-like [Liolophura sinensis]|uniref:synaptic vesicle 2-related protein-like n=1 Tax=Liolophura sinensis TaxID=3198878 RepID=UPI0031592BD2